MSKHLYFNYHFKLIELLLNSTLLGVYAANFMAPLLASYILYDYIPTYLMLIWFLFHLFVLFTRIFIGKKFTKTLKTDQTLHKKYLTIIYMLIFISALLNGLMIWASVIYNVPALEIFILSILVFSLCAGSLSTLSSVFFAYIIYLSVNMTMLISAIIFHGGEMFYLLASNVAVFFVLLLITGYRQHITLRNAILLEDTFLDVYESSSDGIVIVEDGRFKSCNNSVSEMFGFETKDDLLNTDLSLMSPKYQPDGQLSLVKMAKMIKLSSQDGVNSFEWLHTTIDGNEFWCEIVLTKINLDGKNLIHGSWRDISQRKKLELLEIKIKEDLEKRVEEAVEENMIKDRQLLHQSRLAQMGEMIGMIAHQWRQPLSAITSASTSINLKSKLNSLDSKTAQELSENINSYTKHLSDTIDDFRSFFKPNNEKEYTSYNKLLKSVLGIIDDSIDNKNIKLNIDMKCNEEFNIFPNEMKQVILNLIKNAEDALVDNNTRQPYINILSYLDGDNCILEVSDNGGGIREDIMDKIFDPYFSTKTKKDGTGMGLYMSKIIVEEHCSGKLSISNSNDGATFKISIKKT
ncbi:ATP-binding protein [Sulfurimonas sp.]